MTLDLDSAIVNPKERPVYHRHKNSMSLTEKVTRGEEKSFDTEGLEDTAAELIKSATTTLAKAVIKPYGLMDLALSLEARTPWVISGLYADVIKDIGLILGAGYGAIQVWNYFN